MEGQKDIYELKNAALPVPDYLKEILEVDSEKSNAYNLEGELCCTCGCHHFSIKTYAEMDQRNCPHVTQYGNGYAFVIRAVCCDCGADYQVFDLAKHGYDGFVCHDGVTVPDSELKPYSCKTCRENSFKIAIGIEVEDQAQFIEEVVNDFPSEFRKEDYVNAFDGIGLSIKCSKCGQEMENWVGLETS